MKKLILLSTIVLYFFNFAAYTQNQHNFGFGIKLGAGYTHFKNFEGLGARFSVSAETLIKPKIRINAEYSYSNYIYADTNLNLSYYNMHHLGVKSDYLWLITKKIEVFSGLGLYGHYTKGLYLSDELKNEGIMLPEMIQKYFLSALFSSGIRYHPENAPISLEFIPIILNIGKNDYKAFHSELGIIIQF